MGGFGRKLLIYFAIVAVVLGLAFTLTAIETKTKAHNLTNESEIVYEGTYNGKSYKISKRDVLNSILSNGSVSAINEIVNRYLLASYIDAVSDNDPLIDEKLTYLLYGTNDEKTINKYTDEQKADALESFRSRMYLLGYKDDSNNDINTVQVYRDYAKYLVALDNYAKYRIANELSVGATTIALDDETLKTKYAEGYNDALALVLQFNSEAEAKSLLRQYKIVTVSSKLNRYVGDSDVLLEKNTDNTLKLEDGKPVVVKVEKDGVETEVPNYKFKTDEEGNTVYLDENSEWNYELDEEGNPQSLAVEIDASGVTFDSKNSYPISLDDAFTVYVEMYNYLYALTKETVQFDLSYDSFSALLKGDEESLGKLLKEFNLVVVSDENQVKSIRIYVGDEEYLVQVTDGKAESTNGAPVYVKDETSVLVPNYQVEKNEDDSYKFDSNGDFIFIVDENGNKIPLDGKIAIKDITSDKLNDSNTIEAPSYVLYQAYLRLHTKVSAVEGLTEDAFDADKLAANKKAIEALTYNYESLYSVRSGLATSIFKTLKVTDTSTLPYMATPTKYTAAANSSDTSYFLVFKLALDARSDEPTEAELAEVKEKLSEDYFKASNFVNSALAELRKEAGMTLYDEFLGYEYGSSVTNAGISSSSSDDYYTVKKFDKAKLFSINSVEVAKDLTVEGKTFSADDLYNYVSEKQLSIYLANSASKKIFDLMDSNAKLHGTSKNYVNSKNKLVKSYVSVATNVNYYYNYYYANYYTYNEFLYLNYNVKTVTELIEKEVFDTMRSTYLYENIFTNPSDLVLSDYANYLLTLPIFDELYDNYINVNVEHLLVYVDADEDGSPDDWKKYVESVTNGDVVLKDTDGTPLTSDALQAKINALLDKLAEFINDRASQQDDAQTFATAGQDILSDFVTEYNEASIVDSDYAVIKRLGLRVKYENLTSSSSITYKGLDNYVAEFKESTLALANALYNNEEANANGYTSSDTFTTTEFGNHFIAVTKGSSFDKVSAKFANTSGNYSATTVNENDKVSLLERHAPVRRKRCNQPRHVGEDKPPCAADLDVVCRLELRYELVDAARKL